MDHVVTQVDKLEPNPQFFLAIKHHSFTVFQFVDPIWAELMMKNDRQRAGSKIFGSFAWMRAKTPSIVL